MKDLEGPRAGPDHGRDRRRTRGRDHALITGMDQPLGRRWATANEMRESIEVLRGRGPGGRRRADPCPRRGHDGTGAASTAGGNPSTEAITGEALRETDRRCRRPRVATPAVHRGPRPAPDMSEEALSPRPRRRFVTRCDALTIGVVATRLGAGGSTRRTHIDTGVGITLEAKVGDRVEAGQTTGHGSPTTTLPAGRPRRIPLVRPGTISDSPPETRKIWSSNGSKPRSSRACLYGTIGPN